MFLACRHDQMREANRLAKPIAQLTAALFKEASPAPVKYALSLLGFMSPSVRLPLVEVSGESRAVISALLAQINDFYPDQMVGTIVAQEPQREAMAV
jgi:4-hydroxy-tetrahydrodipicolinate synthase